MNEKKWREKEKKNERKKKKDGKKERLKDARLVYNDDLSNGHSRWLKATVVAMREPWSEREGSADVILSRGEMALMKIVMNSNFYVICDSLTETIVCLLKKDVRLYLLRTPPFYYRFYGRGRVGVRRGWFVSQGNIKSFFAFLSWRLCIEKKKISVTIHIISCSTATKTKRKAL